MDDGKTEEIKGLQTGERPLNWTSDGQLYVMPPVSAGATLKVEKLNPHTSTRTPWRTLSIVPIGGVVPNPPFITPDGNTYGFNYRIGLRDLYTVTGVR